jgi:hypothetical protein
VIISARGAVRYFCYVENADNAAAVLSEFLRDEDPVTLATDEDPSWKHYRRLVADIDGF